MIAALMVLGLALGARQAPLPLCACLATSAKGEGFRLVQLLVSDGRQIKVHETLGFLGNYVPAWKAFAASDGEYVYGATLTGARRMGPIEMPKANTSFGVSPDGEMAATYRQPDGILEVRRVDDGRLILRLTAKECRKQGLAVGENRWTNPYGPVLISKARPCTRHFRRTCLPTTGTTALRASSRCAWMARRLTWLGPAGRSASWTVVSSRGFGTAMWALGGAGSTLRGAKSRRYRVTESSFSILTIDLSPSWTACYVQWARGECCRRCLGGTPLNSASGESNGGTLRLIFIPGCVPRGAHGLWSENAKVGRMGGRHPSAPCSSRRREEGEEVCV
jgi:hypothetical protein